MFFVNMEISDICKEFEVYGWCFENTTGNFIGSKYNKENLYEFIENLNTYDEFILLNDFNHTFKFESDEDAVLFKITFSDILVDTN